MEENPEGSVLLNKLKDTLLTNEETKKILETSERDLKESKDRCNEVLKEVHLSAVKALDEAYEDTKNKVQRKHDDLKERLEGKHKILQRSNLGLMTEIVQLAGTKCDESSARKCEDVLESCREALQMRKADHNVVFNFIPTKKLKPKLGVIQLCGNLPSDFKLRLLTPIHDIAIGKQVRCGIEGEFSKENLQHLEFCIRKESNIIASGTPEVEDKLVAFSFRPDAGGIYSVMACLFGLNVVASPLSVVVTPIYLKEESSNSIPLAFANEESKTANMSDDSRAGGNETKLKEVSPIVEQKIIENKENVVDVSVSENEDATFIEETKDEEKAVLDSNNIESVCWSLCLSLTGDYETHQVTINTVRGSGHSMPGSKGKGGLTDVGESDVFYIDRKSGSVIRKYELVDIIQPEDKTKSKCRFINSHEGKVYIVDLGLDCVYILDTNGNQAVSFGSSGTGPGEFNDPAGLVVDDAGNMIVADSRNHRLQVFDREGEYVAVVQVDKPINRPSGVYLDKVCKELYVLNYWGNSLVKYRIG